MSHRGWRKPADERSDLTPREDEVLRCLLTGASNARIARALSVEPRTVRNHLAHIYRKLRVRNRVEAVVFDWQFCSQQGGGN